MFSSSSSTGEKQNKKVCRALNADEGLIKGEDDIWDHNKEEDNNAFEDGNSAKDDSAFEDDNSAFEKDDSAFNNGSSAFKEDD
eukprot:9915611-Ditylum_brightwellii.AAC.1